MRPARLRRLMPRDLSLGNQSVGERTSLHINFRRDYSFGEIYFPQVGRENQTGGRAWRFGVWADGAFAWTSDPSWERDMRYRQDTLVTDVRLSNGQLGLSLHCADVVDYHRDIYIKRITIRNQRDSARDIRLFLHQNPFLKGSAAQNTAVYDPDLRGILCYRGDRWLLAGAFRDGVNGVDHFAAGLKEVMGLEGVWRACESGRLNDQPVQHGSVDAAIELDIELGSHEEKTVYFYLCFGESETIVRDHYARLETLGPEKMIERTDHFWRLWVKSHRRDFGNLPGSIVSLYRRSLLTIRTLCDQEGAIIAAVDWDVASNIRENYSYCWMRDGALIAQALQRAGFEPPSSEFFAFCLRVLERENRPYFMHKYNADGTVGSSWLPRIGDSGEERLPIQGDETAIVLFALWEHYARFRQMTHALREQIYRMVFPAADWLCEYMQGGLPKPSYDLWEERFGVHLHTVATVFGALRAAEDFAVLLAEEERSMRYAQAKERLKERIIERFWSEEQGYFLRMLQSDGEGRLSSSHPDCQKLDAAGAALLHFGVLSPEDPRLIAMMKKIRERLWVKTDIGGLARYEDDYYHQVEHEDKERVPGNPWFICTLWLADWEIARAKSREDLDEALRILEWVAERALPSGLLAEQVHPYTGEPLSVSPLTWSHASFVATCEAYLESYAKLPESTKP